MTDRNNRRNAKDNRWKDIHGGMAFIIPISCLQSSNFKNLSPRGCKLLLDFGRQYSGYNNGYLCVTPSLLLKQGWKSTASIWEAVAECEHYGLITKTQQGGKNRPSYYAITWRRIDCMENRSPLDVGKTFKPSNDWLADKPPFIKHTRKKILDTHAVSNCTPIGIRQKKLNHQRG